jgi:hypothetical protein
MAQPHENAWFHSEQTQAMSEAVGTSLEIAVRK